MIRRLRSLFGQPGFAVLAALIGALAFNWPVLESVRAQGEFPLFVYFFAGWAGAILLAFLISKAAADPDAPKGDSDA